MKQKSSKEISPPLFEGKVAAGFPSPAEDVIERELDLNELLVKRPAATFFVRVTGSSMVGAGIHDQDILVVDRSLQATSGKIVVASIHGELTVKRLVQNGEAWQLIPENKDFPVVTLTSEMELHVWGVVTAVIHPV